MKIYIFICVLFLLGCGTNDQVETDHKITLLEMQLDSLQLDYSARIGMLIFELDTLKSRVARNHAYIKNILEASLEEAKWHEEFSTQYVALVESAQELRSNYNDHLSLLH